jgi:hypothetical protein
MVNFQVVDAQNTKAKQNKQHIKEKLYIYPIPIYASADIHPAKICVLIKKSLAYVAKE